MLSVLFLVLVVASAVGSLVLGLWLGWREGWASGYEAAEHELLVHDLDVVEPAASFVWGEAA